MTTRILRRYLHIRRVVPEIDAELSEGLQDKTINPKKLWTRRNMGLRRLPVELEYAAQAKIKSIADSKFRENVRQLVSIMHKFKLPDDRSSVKNKRADIKTELELRDKVKNFSPYDSDDEYTLEESIRLENDRLAQLITGKLQEKLRHWHYYEYDDYASCLYMATRLAPNYACLKIVMDEIRALVPDYRPDSVLDFGSGMGTSLWAVNETWPNCVGEFMNIELAKDQQSLCEYLLRGGREHGQSIGNLYQRQYLPASSHTKYDIVVSSFSLLELPNAQFRVQTLESLWDKTNDFLILVERGNLGGFTAIKEARHLILDLSGHDTTRKQVLSSCPHLRLDYTAPESHVFAPCPHEFTCPRSLMPSKKDMNVCRFQAIFEPLDLGTRKGGFLREEFSYVVLRKGPIDNPSMRLPRIVERRHHSRNQITHRLCCSDGDLGETVITKRNCVREAYDLAKSCDWGDQLPVKINDNYIQKSTSIKKISSGPICSGED